MFAYITWLLSPLQPVSVGQGGIAGYVAGRRDWLLLVVMLRPTRPDSFVPFLFVRVFVSMMWLVPALQHVSVGPGGIVG